MKPENAYSRIIRTSLVLAAICLLIASGLFPTPARAQADDPNPPSEVVKLIFIHHSCGENWLMDDHGGLGRALGENNYYVSDTNYGWGPDSIGDATDIINWPYWFTGPDSDRYLAALYAESGQNSYYTRNLQDPGGENQIVMFKSCFPNSAIEGSPNDPPAPGDGLTVSNAKYIYNDLLNYFATRPDKLFVAITAPPLMDPTYAANARAFDTWLVQDWLSENNYTQSNVAVWDFHAVLTHPDNHHRYNNGQIEYITSNGNTLYYDSEGDEHPNPSGNQKATAEFIPMLNIFYNRWRAGAPAAPPPEQDTEPPQPTEEAAQPPTEEAAQPPPEETQPAVGEAVPASADLIDDFEAGPPAGTDGWQSYWDEGTQTTFSCTPEAGVVYSGNTAMHLNFNVVANSWATCALVYNEIHDWSSMQGLSFYIHASQPALVFDVIAHGGAPGAMATYLYTLETTQEMVDGWVRMELPWDMILGADWEGNAGQPFNPTQSLGISLGIGTHPDAPNAGEIWVDEVRLISGSAPAPEAPPPTAEEAPPPAQETPVEEAPAAELAEPTEAADAPQQGGESGGESRRLCSGPPALALLVAVGALWAKRRNLLA